MAASLKLSGKRAGGELSFVGEDLIKTKGKTRATRPVQREFSSLSWVGVGTDGRE